MFMTVGDPTFQTARISDKLWRSLAVGFQHLGVEQALMDPQIALACQLFIDSQFEASDEARLLSSMGVLEVLKDRGDASPALQELVGSWLEEAARLDEPERSSARSTLNFMKYISISRGIRGVVERHLGHEKARDAGRLYGIRSKLVHEGERPADLARAARQAENIARDLLAKVLLAAGLA